MRLNLAREHYKSMDYGRTWIPKIPFESEQDAIEKGNNPNKWKIYPCTFCKYYHVAKKGQRSRKR